MSRLLTSALAAAEALGLATPTLAQKTMGNSEMPWCSSTVTDKCRQHEGISGKHHRMMHRMMKHHETMKENVISFGRRLCHVQPWSKT